MAESSGSGVPLARLFEHRNLDVGHLSRLAEVGEPELRAVFDGAVPNPLLLRRLASVLDLHAADVFAIAGVGVPDDLAPLDAKAGERVPDLVECALRLSADDRRRLRRLIQSLPQRNRTQPMPPPRVYEPGFGAVLRGMLGNRNLNWPETAYVMAHVTKGRVYVAASRIARVGNGVKEPTPDLLSGLAITLGVPVDDLAALADVDLTGSTVPQNPAATDTAELIWDVRRLTVDQMRHVYDTAKAMQQD